VPRAIVARTWSRDEELTWSDEARVIRQTTDDWIDPRRARDPDEPGREMAEEHGDGSGRGGGDGGM